LTKDNPKNISKQIPQLLLWSRFVIAVILLIDASDGKTDFWFSIGLIYAIVSDFFDGVIARRLGVATNGLRRWDSFIDSFLIIAVALSVFLAHPQVFQEYQSGFLVFFSLYFLSVIIPWIKFRNLPAYHAYSAKLAGLVMAFAMIWLFAFGPSKILLWGAFVFGSLSHVERIIIALILPEQREDVAGFWVANEIRKNSQ
jgi:phosphatidylglycerophosphate synthase